MKIKLRPFRANSWARLIYIRSSRKPVCKASVRVNMKDFQDIVIRFFIGGTVVALVYILAALLPWRSLAGVFAAFPGVMATAVSLAGWRQGNLNAAEVAKGSVIGMLGSTACVLATLFILKFLNNWWLALSIAIFVWFGASLIIHGLLGLFH